MNRLLQGDVGSGKTLVALLAMLAAVEAGGQAAMMAPTEILARQHLLSLAPLAEAAGVRLDILTGRDKGAERAAKLAALAAGEIAILVGTHALFQKDVAFHDLRLAVVDEQHRFGVRQRMDLGEKGSAADILVMTATPIPRSLTLAQYGDMDLSRTRREAAGTPAGRDRAHLLRPHGGGDRPPAPRPRRGPPGLLGLPAGGRVRGGRDDRRRGAVRAPGARARRGRRGLVHGQMPPAQKDAAMADFVAGRTRLLVATTVIEVGRRRARTPRSW